MPGIFAVVSGPLADRIGHMLSGVSAPVAIKVFGPDLDKLRQIGIEVQTVAKTIPGFEDAKLDQQSSIPQLRIEADRDRAAAYGIAPGHFNEQLSALIGGKEVAELREGQRAVNLVTAAARSSGAIRRTKSRSCPSKPTTGQRIPLSLVADVREAKGPNVIFRENSQRRFTIAIKPTVRDVGVLVERLQKEVTEKVTLPEGYFITYEGEFQAQKDATQRIVIFSARRARGHRLPALRLFQDAVLRLPGALRHPARARRRAGLHLPEARTTSASPRSSASSPWPASPRGTASC